MHDTDSGRCYRADTRAISHFLHHLKISSLLINADFFFGLDNQLIILKLIVFISGSAFFFK